MKEFVRERRQGRERDSELRKKRDRPTSNDGDRKEGTATRDAPATCRRRRDRMRNFDALVLGIRRQETHRNFLQRCLLERINFFPFAEVREKEKEKERRFDGSRYLIPFPTYVPSIAIEIILCIYLVTIRQSPERERENGRRDAFDRVCDTPCTQPSRREKSDLSCVQFPWQPISWRCNSPPNDASYQTFRFDFSLARSRTCYSSVALRHRDKCRSQMPRTEFHFAFPSDWVSR